MPHVEPELGRLLTIPRLAALATAAWPAWLWRTDGSRVIWANAVGAAMFGAGDIEECAKLHFSTTDLAAGQIIRLAASLAAGGRERLERLRGFGAGFGRLLTCACSRLDLPDGSSAVLVAAAESAGTVLSLRERVRRLFAHEAQALACFAADGTLVHATAAALAHLGGATTLSALGLDRLAATTLETGPTKTCATIATSPMEITAMRLGTGGSQILALSLQPEQSAGASPAATIANPAPSAPVATVEAEPALAASPHPAPPHADPPDAARRHPLRFVWQMDEVGRFAIGSDEFIELVGPRTIAACGRLWSEIAAALNLDPDQQVARAVATRETWSGVAISWPVDGTDEALPIELSGLPIFDRDRTFRGYRGFGVCRDVARVNRLAQTRRARPLGFATPPRPADAGADSGDAAHASAALSAASAASLRALTAAGPSDETGAIAPPASAKVVQLRPAPAPPSLSAIERNAFRELAQELSARLRGDQHDQGAVAECREPSSNFPQPVPGSAAAPAASRSVSEPSEVNAADAVRADGGAEPVLADPTGAAQVLLDRVPAAVIVHRNDAVLYANRHFFELSGYNDLNSFAAAGGLAALFADATTGMPVGEGPQKLTLVTQRGDRRAVDGRLFTTPWTGGSALALILTSGEADERWRAAQNELRDVKAILDRTAKREAEKAAAAKASFLTKVSHEIRTPLNSIIGFAEVIMAERFGSIGNERYREYLRDIHSAGTHLLAMLNDLLDLSKIETGQLDLSFANLDLNELTQHCVGIMQPQANRARIIIRSALAPGLPQVVADQPTLQQIVINLLSHAIKFTGPGGQVIVSTAAGDGGAAVLRVRDTSAGMEEKDIQAALDPFRETAGSSNWGFGASGLGLPLTKALAEANRADFSIKSTPNSGTLVEIAFPPGRTVAR